MPCKILIINMYFPYSFFAQGSSLSNHLLVYYKLDSNSNDSLGNHNLSTVGSISYTTGKISNGLNINNDQNSNYLTVSNHSDFLLNGNKTFTIWFKSDTNGNTGMLFTKAGFSSLEYFLQFQIGTNISFAVYDGSLTSVTVTTTDSLSANTWYFCVAIFDATNQIISIQLNNSSKNSESIAGLSNFDTNTNNFNLGGDQFYGTATSVDNTIIDECAIFNKVLTEPEISYLYNNGVGRTYPLA